MKSCRCLQACSDFHIKPADGRKEQKIPAIQINQPSRNSWTRPASMPPVDIRRPDNMPIHTTT